MKTSCRALVAVSLVGVLSGCGSYTVEGGSSSPQATLHLTLDVTVPADSLMATIAVRSVFDPNVVFLIDCNQKPHQLDGTDFCDELLVVPPGVYDIIVQANDPSCHSEQSWYKLVVSANTTTEVPITLVCGEQTGGLDVIVNTEYVPSIIGISFLHVDGTIANKFICQGVCGTDVTATVQVVDSDSPCSELTNYTFKAVNSQGVDVTSTLIVSTTASSNSVCLFSAVIDAQAPLGDYTITFKVTDLEGHTATFSFPVHLIDCGGPPAFFSNTAMAAGSYLQTVYRDFDSAHFNIDPALAAAHYRDGPTVFTPADPIIGGVDLGNLPLYLLFYADGSGDANWQGATKGFIGDVGVDGIQASERTSGGVPYAGTIFTNDTTLGAWQAIVDQNVGQASGVTGQITRIADLQADLVSAIQQINALAPSPGFSSVNVTALDGLNTQNGINEVFVINITSGLGFSQQVNITGDPGDVFFLRWDSDGNPANGYQGQAKPQSGGAIVPHGGLTPSNFINVAGDLGSSGGGSTPPPPYPQGPRYNDGQGALIVGGSDFSGGGFFTGYWLTTGSPDVLDPASGLYVGPTSSLSNGIFVGGWYSLTTQFSMTSGTSGVYVAPNPPTIILPAIDVEKYVSVDGGVTWDDADLSPGPSVPVGAPVEFRFVVTNTGNATLAPVVVNDDVFGFIGSLTSLAPGGSFTFPVLPSTAAAGQHVDTATATGTYLGTPYTDSDPAHYVGAAQPAIDVEKLVSVDNGLTWQDADSATGPLAPPGINPRFELVVTNIGTDTLNNVTLTDSVFGSLTLPVTTLTPGSWITIHVTWPWAAGQHVDTATATGVSATTGQTVTDSDPAHYFGVLTPSIDVEKEVSVDGGLTWHDADLPPGPFSMIGAPNPLFRFTVTNTGNATLNPVMVTDDVFGAIGTITNLAPGQTYTFLPPKSEPWTSGQHVDIATAIGLYDSSSVTDHDPAYYYGETPIPSLDLEKLVSVDGCNTWLDADLPTGPYAPFGVNPCFQFIVTNTGTDVLTNVTLSDTVFGPIALPFTTLLPGQSTTAQVVGVWAAGQHQDIATARGVASTTGQPYTDEDPAHYFGVVYPGLDLEKLVSVDGGATWVDADMLPGPYLAPGFVPEFKYVVINTGDVPLTGVTVTDNVFGAVADFNTMQPGDVREATVYGTNPGTQCL